MKQTYYQILHIDSSADFETIKAAHRRLAKQYHPDFNRAPDAKATMQRINEAYATLSDATKRAAYDQSLQPARQPSTVWAGMPEARRTYAQDVVERSMWQRDSGVSLREKKRDFSDAWRAIMPDLRLEQNCIVQLDQTNESRLKVHFAVPVLRLIIDIDKQETLQAFNAITEQRRYDHINTWHVLRFSEAEMYSDPHECVVIAADLIDSIIDVDAEHHEQQPTAPPPLWVVGVYWFACWIGFGMAGAETGLLLANYAMDRLALAPLIVLKINLWLWLMAAGMMLLGWGLGRGFARRYWRNSVSHAVAWGSVASVLLVSLSLAWFLTRFAPLLGLSGQQHVLLLAGVAISSLLVAANGWDVLRRQTSEQEAQ